MRYERNIIVPNFGEESQSKLGDAKVLVVGAGGLGSAALMYLVASGVGTIGIVEFDTVSDTNLQRQLLYVTSDLNRPKIDAAFERLSDLNPEIEIKKYPVKLSDDNAAYIFSDYDIVVDCTDNFRARYIISFYSYAAQIPMVYGTAQECGGQLSVFNYENSGRYSDLYPESDAIDDTTAVGVLSPIPGIIGSLQAMEVIKLITGYGEPLCGKLLVVDAGTMQFTTFQI